jgi:hypothetical protein
MSNTLITQGYDFWGPFLQSLGIQGVTAFVPLSVLRDGVRYGAANTTTSSSSISIPANTLSVGRSLVFKVWGTIVGANAAKTIELVVGSTVLASTTFAATTVGNFYSEFTLMEVTDKAHQLLGAFGVCGTKVGATTDLAVDNEAATQNVATDLTFQINLISANAGDTITQTMCIAELLA